MLEDGIAYLRAPQLDVAEVHVAVPALVDLGVGRVAARQVGAVEDQADVQRTVGQFVFWQLGGCQLGGQVGRRRLGKHRTPGGAIAASHRAMLAAEDRDQLETRLRPFYLACG